MAPTVRNPQGQENHDQGRSDDVQHRQPRAQGGDVLAQFVLDGAEFTPDFRPAVEETLDFIRLLRVEDAEVALPAASGLHLGEGALRFRQLLVQTLLRRPVLAFRLTAKGLLTNPLILAW